MKLPIASFDPAFRRRFCAALYACATVARTIVLLAALGLTLLSLAAYAEEPSPSGPQAVAEDTEDTKVREQVLTFAQLGWSRPTELRGVQSIAEVSLGSRGDEVVVAAKLRLRFTYSPSLLPELSHLRIRLNDQVLAAIALPREQAGREIEREVVLDPRYFSDYNLIRIDFIGHYTLECEDPQHSSLWSSISQTSSIELRTRRLELRNDLAFLPAPFFDRRDNRRLELPVSLPANPSLPLVRAAGIATSWFGVLADYRSARFPVSFDTLPERHALVFATNKARPKGLTLTAVEQPTISIIDHPRNSAFKLLVFQGKDEAQLTQAVMGLVLGNPVVSGSTATVSRTKYQRREAYDAPRWVRSDRAVKLGELVDSPTQLEVTGLAPPPIRINLRLPPDLFIWNRAGVPIDLRYRYTARRTADNSLLTVSVNNQLLRTYRLEPESSDLGGKLLVPLLQNPTTQQSQDLVIPAFQLGSNNELQLQFALDHQREGLCSHVFVDTPRQAIDPDSSIDVSGFPHYTAMPNLALFANAGFPFTRYADLGDTAIVLPNTANAAALEQLFFVLGRMGRHTGAVAAAYQLLDAAAAEKARDLDLLLLSDPQSNRLLSRWGKDLSLVLEEAEREFRGPAVAPSFVASQLGTPTLPRSGDVVLRTTGSLGAYISFESPLSARRTVVALTATDTAATAALIDTLEDDGKVGAIRGDLAVVRAQAVQSFQSGEVYFVGSLSWWRWLWFHLSRHPILFSLLAIIATVGAALWIYGWLQRRVAKRLEGNAPAAH